MENRQTATLRLYSPHEKQLEFHNSKAKFRVAAWGRQSGKSTACLNDLLSKAWKSPGTKYWFLSPTYDQAKEQYRRAVKALFGCNILVKKNQTELRIKLINQSEVCFKSGEVFDNLRGETLHGVVIDEVRDQRPELWTQVIHPMLATTDGWAAFVSTPRGFDQFYDFAQRAIKSTNGEWSLTQSPSTCNPLFKQSTFERLKNEMSEPEFAQEILAEFRDLHQGKAYLNFGKENLSLINPFTGQDSWSPNLPIIIGLDFNVNPMAWVLGQNRAEDWYFRDEIFVRNTNTQQCVPELLNKIQGHKPGVILCGDSTGKSRKTSASESDYAIITNALRQANIKYSDRTPDSNPLVKDRVNTVNAKLKSADGKRHLFIHPVKCPMSLRDFERVSWKQGAQVILDQTTNKELTHASDAIGYPICALDPIRSSGGVGSLYVINR